ncbi:MAG: S1/P1 nuclease [Alistipes sp.]|nr:S1/P1 nuclease [Alistipes sp.]
MKRLTLTLIALAVSLSTFAWGRLGHEIVIAVAQRHLTEKAKANIAKYIDYDLKKDAVWMDTHRRDKEIAYTTHYHVLACDKNLRYDPNYRLEMGDLVLALRTAEYNLGEGNYRNMTDSAVVFNIRMLIHFMGDMHCPVHAHVDGVKTIWKCRLNGKEWERFHPIYDKIPMMLYGKDADPDSIAAQIDNLKAKAIKKVTKGDLYRAANEAIKGSVAIYDINPYGTYNLADDTVERSRPIIDRQLRDAGYRLAAKLNEYFNH